MSIYASLVNHDASISTINATAWAEAQCGSNGYFWGQPEIKAGGGSSPVSTGRVAWDDNPDDGFDTTLKDAEVSLQSGGSSSLSFATSASPGPVTYAVGSTGHVEKVKLRALALIPGVADWESVTVTFYKNGVPTDSYTGDASAMVDTTNYSGSVFAESILEIGSDRTDNDAVVVTGKYRLACPEGYYPDPGDLAAQVFVFCADAI